MEQDRTSSRIKAHETELRISSDTDTKLGVTCLRLVLSCVLPLTIVDAGVLAIVVGTWLRCGSY